MSIFRSILDRLPEYVPDGTIAVSEEHEFRTDGDGNIQTQYTLNKAPFERIESVEAVVDGFTTDLSVESDISIANTDSTPGPDSVVFTNSAVYPDIGTTFSVDYRVDPVITRYVSPFDTDISNVGSDIDEAIAGKYIDTAPGDSLDQIGAAYGDIGRRRRRSDAEYRSFLRSIVRAFNANGTVQDVKFAVAAALRGDPDDVTIEEDFEQNGFSVYVDAADSEVVTTSLDDLIQLASPTGVELLQSPVIQTEQTTITVTGSDSTVVSRVDGVGSETISSGDTLN